MRFERDFIGAKVVRLERNYRSTQHILGAASGLIAANRDRLGKTLWTEDSSGDKVRVRGVWDGEAEARLVADEIETAKRGLIETFPRQFESKPAMLQVFVNDEWTKRPKNFWKTYREKLEAVTATDIQRVAKKHINPESMAILIVGDWKEIAPGDLEKRASMKEFFGGKVTHLPLRDPLTLEPLP